MKLILTRHGETIENKKGIMQGWLHGRLSTLGKKQAKLLARRLKNTKIDVIYTSDLSRAYDTAKEIAKYHKKSKLIKDKRLREINLGEFQGKKGREVNWEGLPGTKLTRKPKKGESFVEIYKRINSFYKFLFKEYNKETILIIGHGGSVLLLEGLIKNQKLEYIVVDRNLNNRLKNTAISEYEIDKKGKIKVIRINCDKHLK